MSEEVAQKTPKALVLPKRIDYGMNYLKLPKDVTDDEIRETVSCLRLVDNSFKWLLGDLLCQVGEMRNVETVNEISAMFDRGERTGFYALAVCRQISHCNRLQSLTFTHHQVALDESETLKEAMKWLKAAAKDNWSCGELRKQIRLSHSLKTGSPSGERRKAYAPLYGAVAACKAIKIEHLSTTDREILQQDIMPLIDWSRKLFGGSFPADPPARV